MPSKVKQKMKYLSTLMAILCVLVIHTPKGVYLQETTPPPPTPPSPAPIPEEVVAYINERIDAALAANPELDSSQLLFTGFNAERRRLLDARIGETVQAGDDVTAEQALRSFNRLVVEFHVIRSRLEAAVNDLNSIETNPNQPIIVRYNALELLNEIRYSNSLADAQRALQDYNNFKLNLATSPEVTSVTPITTITSVTPITTVIPPLSDENRKHFEEILNMLRQFGVDVNDPTVLSFLKNILLRPKDLRALAADARRLLRRFLHYLG